KLGRNGTEPTPVVERGGGVPAGIGSGPLPRRAGRSGAEPETPRWTGQILPTRSSDGVMVLAPSFHLAGQTSPGCSATYLAAFSLRSVSLTSRAMALSWTSIVLITPSGLMM